MVFLSTKAKIGLFIGAYFPLWLILLVKMIYEGSDLISIILMFLFVLFSLSIVPSILNTIDKVGKVKIVKPQTKEEISKDYFTYILPYIVPLAQQNINGLEDFIVIFILLLVILFIYIKANLIYFNPIFLLLEYHVFKIQDENGNEYIIISKKNILRNIKITTRELDKGILIYSKTGDRDARSN